MFKVDDKVVCICDTGWPHSLTEGKVYTVKASSLDMVWINSDKNEIENFYNGRFSLVEEPSYFTNDNRFLRSKKECMEHLSKYGGTLYKKVAEVTLETTTVVNIKEF